MPRIAWDFDDTLSDWRAGFHAWMEGQGHPGSIPLLQSRLFSLEDVWPSLAPAELAMRRSAYNLVPAFASMPAIPGAWEAVAECAAHGFEPIAITAPGTHPDTVSRRMAQMEPFGFAESHVLASGAGKIPLAREAGAVVLVDDSPAVLAEALRAGFPVVAVDTPYNQGIQVPRIRSWHDDLSVLLEVADAARRAERRSIRRIRAA